MLSENELNILKPITFGISTPFLKFYEFFSLAKDVLKMSHNRFIFSKMEVMIIIFLNFNENISDYLEDWIYILKPYRGFLYLLGNL